MDVNEIIEYIGFKPEEVKSLDDLKTKFDSEFIRTSTLHKDHEVVKKFTGAILGGIETDTIKLAKQYGLEKDEFITDKSKKVTDKFQYVLNKQTEALTNIQKELEGKLALTGDDKIKDYQEKLDKEKLKRKETEKLLESVKQTLEEKESSWKNEIKNTKLSIKKNDVLSKINWADGVDELKKEGFLARIEKAYEFDMDDTEELLALDKTSKSPIISTKKAGSHKTPLEILEEEGVKFGVWKANKDAGKPVKKVIEQKPDPTPVSNRKLSSLVGR